MYHRSPSSWLGLHQSTEVADHLLALDFDAACMRLGLDAEEQIRRQRDVNQGVIKRTMGQ